MKTKHFITALLIIIMNYGCTHLCRLTDDDKDWILDEYKSLNYLENDTKTIKVDITNEVVRSWNHDGWWPTGEGYEGGASIIYLQDSLYQVCITSPACMNKGGIDIYKRISSDYPIAMFTYYKDSLTNNKVTVLNKEYDNCFVYQDSTYFKNLTFVKSYGIVKIEFRDGYKLELIP